jgi:GNAT superfamily N-acetyltransferase
MSGEPRPRTLLARITHLEMTAPPPVRVHAPSGPRLALMRCEAIPPAYYRYLYEQVGRAHHWLMRRDADDETLRGDLHGDSVEIQVLYVDGAPAGFFELDLTARPDAVDIRYFGLTPDFQGRGLGRFFLSEAVFAAFAHRPARVTIQTNTLDSPRALQLYQRAGFNAVAWSEEQVEAWD